MSRQRGKLDPKQQSLFEERVIAHLQEKEALLESIGRTPEPRTMESFAEACVELAASVKRAYRKWGGSREQLVDAINAYFGWNSPSPRPSPARGEGELKGHSPTKGEGGKSLSIHMLNHYLSKPAEYPIPGALLFAIHHITASLEPCHCLAEAEGGDVISQEDKQLLMLGKMETAVWELNRLKRELKNGGR